MKRPLLVLALLAAIAPVPALATRPDPLTRPITSARAADWVAPRKAVHVHGGTWLTGSLHLDTAVIDTGAGLIVVDGALPQSVPAFEAQLAAMGHTARDIRYILTTEAHYDHAGGVAALARDSGAVVVASAYTARALQNGKTGREDPQFADVLPFPKVDRLKVLADGGQIKLGNTVVTMQFTPGHTQGSTSWSWKSCDAGADCRNIVFMASLNPGSSDGWRFSAPAHASVLAQFAPTYAKVRKLPCDILLTGHPEHSDADAKIKAALVAPTPAIWTNPQACIAMANRFEGVLAGKLAAEHAAKP